MSGKPDAIIKVEFIMNFTPNEKGKLSSEVKFSTPSCPDKELNDNLRRLALEKVGELAHQIITHPDGLPQ